MRTVLWAVASIGLMGTAGCGVQAEQGESLGVLSQQAEIGNPTSGTIPLLDHPPTQKEFENAEFIESDKIPVYYDGPFKEIVNKDGPVQVDEHVSVEYMQPGYLFSGEYLPCLDEEGPTWTVTTSATERMTDIEGRYICRDRTEVTTHHEVRKAVGFRGMFHVLRQNVEAEWWYNFLDTVSDFMTHLPAPSADTSTGLGVAATFWTFTSDSNIGVCLFAGSTVLKVNLIAIAAGAGLKAVTDLWQMLGVTPPVWTYEGTRTGYIGYVLYPMDQASTKTTRGLWYPCMGEDGELGGDDVVPDPGDGVVGKTGGVEATTAPKPIEAFVPPAE